MSSRFVRRPGSASKGGGPKGRSPYKDGQFKPAAGSGGARKSDSRSSQSRFQDNRRDQSRSQQSPYQDMRRSKPGDQDRRSPVGRTQSGRGGASARDFSRISRPERTRYGRERDSLERFGRSSDPGERSDERPQLRSKGDRRPQPRRSGLGRSPSRNLQEERGRPSKPRVGARARLPEARRSDFRQSTLKQEVVAEAEVLGAAPPDDILWGRHTTQAALEARRPIHRIWCTSELRSASRFLQLLRDAKASGVLVEEVSWARLGQITCGAVHQGIALQIASAETLDLDSLIEGCKDLGEAPLLLALDGLTDPHNLGAIVRSAEALGAHGVVLPQRRSAGLTGSVAKVAAGALEHLPVARVVNLNRSLEYCKKHGYRVLGLAEEGDLTLAEADLEGPLVLVTGSEDQGLSLLTRRHCDQLIRIPLRGMTPNLNASVATALCVYEVARRGWMKDLRGQAPSPKMLRARFSPALPGDQAAPQPGDDQITAEQLPQVKSSHSNAETSERIDLDSAASQEHFDRNIQL